MSNADSRQVGGDHYIKHKYEHWNWVDDVGLHYYLAVATKYIARWRDKNGIQDLQKSIHYLEKADERNVFAPEMTDEVHNLALKFARQSPNPEGTIIMCIMLDDYSDAIRGIQLLIKEAEAAEEEQAQNEIIEARKRDGV